MRDPRRIQEAVEAYFQLCGARIDADRQAAFLRAFEDYHPGQLMAAARKAATYDGPPNSSKLHKAYQEVGREREPASRTVETWHPLDLNREERAQVERIRQEALQVEGGDDGMAAVVSYLRGRGKLRTSKVWTPGQKGAQG